MIASITFAPMPKHEEPVAAYFSVLFIGNGGERLVIRDMKLVRMKNGEFLIQFPNRKRVNRCVNCRCKNDFDSQYCCQCGVVLPSDVPVLSAGGGEIRYCDTTRPADSDTRERMTRVIAEAYQAWLKSNVGGDKAYTVELK